MLRHWTLLANCHHSRWHCTPLKHTLKWNTHREKSKEKKKGNNTPNRQKGNNTPTHTQNNNNNKTKRHAQKQNIQNPPHPKKPQEQHKKPNNNKKPNQPSKPNDYAYSTKHLQGLWKKQQHILSRLFVRKFVYTMYDTSRSLWVMGYEWWIAQSDFWLELSFTLILWKTFTVGVVSRIRIVWLWASYLIFKMTPSQYCRIHYNANVKHSTKTLLPRPKTKICKA